MRAFVLAILTLSCLRASAFDGVDPSQEPSALGGFAHISKRVLADLLRRELTLDQRITETIMNMTMRGTAHVTCQIGLDLIPNPNIANLRLTMTGRASMDDGVATMRRIQVFSSSNTQISGSKDVFFSTEGLRLVPTRADCRTSIQVHDIAAPLRLIERIAWRRVSSMQSDVENSASQRASRRAEQQLEAEAGRPLAQLHRQYLESVYQPLVRRKALPDVRFSTTQGHLSVRLLSRDKQREEVVGTAPETACDIAVCLSDSYVNELAALLIGGATFADHQFADLMATITGKTPRPLWVHARAEPWSVVADASCPLTVSFDDNQINVALRIGRALRGQETLKRPIDIAASYSLEITPDGPRLIRVGDVGIKFADGGSAYETFEEQFRDFLRRKFSGVFLSEIYFDGLMPPVGGSWGKLRRLNLTQFESGHGWFALGYELPEAVSRTAANTDNRLRRN
jgi:hypothetical protein